MATNKHREKQIEARIIKRAREHKGIAFKFTSPGRRAVPDRLCVVPCFAFGLQPFIEAKRPGEVPTPSQEREHVRIRKAGGTVFVVDTYETVDTLFESLCDGSCTERYGANRESSDG